MTRGSRVTSPLDRALTHMDPVYLLGGFCIAYTVLELRAIARRMAERRDRTFEQHARRFAAARPVPPSPAASGYSARSPATGRVIDVEAIRV